MRKRVRGLPIPQNAQRHVDLGVYFDLVSNFVDTTVGDTIYPGFFTKIENVIKADILRKRYQ